MRLRLGIVLILLSLATLSAQTFRGGIQGTVTDASGAAVSGAQVTVTKPAPPSAAPPPPTS